MPPIEPKDPNVVAAERHEIFSRACAALWSEQCQLPRNPHPSKQSNLGVVVSPLSFTFFVEWHDGINWKRKTTSFSLHELCENPAFNFTVVFRTLIRGAGL